MKFWFCAIAIPLLCPLSVAKGEDIVVSTEQDQDYYHLELTLSADRLEPKSSMSHSKRLNTLFHKGGQFDIGVDKNALPPSVTPTFPQKYIRLRMQRTLPEVPGASLYIHEKRMIFDEINELRQSSLGSMSVVIQLRQGVKLISEDPVQLNLTEPVATFRQAYGRYINYTGPLKEADQQPKEPSDTTH